MSRGLSHPTCQAAYAPFTPSDSGQRSPPTSYRGCWHVVSRGFLFRYRQPRAPHPRPSSRTTGVYTPKGFLPHAASLRQAFAHCARFPTAASRRSLGRVSVPVWPFTLSGRLPVVALVGRYPTNELMGRGPLRQRPPLQRPFLHTPCGARTVCGISPSFPGLSPTAGQVTHVLLTRPPLGDRRASSPISPLDLHVLGTPPAFVLSQDQTLLRNAHPSRRRASGSPRRPRLTPPGPRHSPHPGPAE